MSKKNTKKLSQEELDALSAASRKETYDWIQSLSGALIFCVIIFVFFIRVIDVKGTSMNPTLNNQDKMLVSGLFYKPEAGDIVVFKKDSYSPDKALVKRVIATEGQEINIDFDRGIVYVDGVALEEDYISELTTTKLDFIGPKTVPEGCVFVMGDNRNMSTDSRDKDIDMVDERLIIGKVYCVLFPLSSFGLVE
ncbi:MAG: signal peptidase I [Oscillospiraceae bacterium]|nr:signal peptidase I [Oscillospiraceae bacterium]